MAICPRTSSFTMIPTKFEQNLTSTGSIIFYGMTQVFLEDRPDKKHVTVSMNNWFEAERRGAKYVIYVMDQTRTNPYEVWGKYGKPVFPNATVRREMRYVEEPLRFLGPADLILPNIKISILMSVPSVALIHLCAYGEHIPGPVYSINIFNVTRNEILLTWKYNIAKTECIKTYEIEHEMECRSAGFQRINLEKDTVFLSYHYHPVLEFECVNNPHSLSDEHGERFYQQMKAIERRYHGF
ncbi:unnamed protein product [Brassicogethes aeneus]|uniref:Alpha-L-iduronidase C-terminal domain-containing protein n=1 Tax=Brassicogethes aeneus TaxID=1431903 RepID=A0A9P0BBT7_BRAAE|nr:unnamed protein product [Brassicogethes aeneus]